MILSWKNGFEAYSFLTNVRRFPKRQLWSELRTALRGQGWVEARRFFGHWSRHRELACVVRYGVVDGEASQDALVVDVDSLVKQCECEVRAMPLLWQGDLDRIRSANIWVRMGAC